LGDHEKHLPASRKPAAEGFCYAGMLLAVLWLVNNIRVHQYILYWWKKAEGIEKLLGGPEEARLVYGYDKHRLPKHIRGDYHLLDEFRSGAFPVGLDWHPHSLLLSE
jgi:hypothetical protein